jgi:hypothetical protein
MAGLVDLGMALGAPLTKIVGDVLNRVLPAEKMSEKDRAVIESQVLLELQKADFGALNAQLAINLEEAKGGFFVAGWRPFIGWVCGSSLAYTFVVQPFMAFAIGVFAWKLPPLPVLDTGSLMTILLGMLGLGGMRTYEKIKGVSGGK